MAPPEKTVDGRRKSGSKPSLLVTLNVPSSPLREILLPSSPKEDTPSVRDFSGVKDIKDSPAASSNSAAQAHFNGEHALESATLTPAAEDTPAPSLMGPPTDGRKRKGIKRSAATVNGTQDGTPRPRGKPGPKKKPRLEDGTIDHSGVANRPAGAHKLGPKANQGAINAGLRALDRSGKPCRRWCRGGFKLKSFTGVVWEVSRWNAPPKKETMESTNDDSGAPSADNNGCKDNKENEAEPMSGSNSNSGADVEMTSANASPPATMAVTMAA